MNTDMSKLKECLSKGLYLDNLHEMITICNSAIEKSAEPLPIYVLLSIFSDIYSSWDDRPLLVEEVERTEVSLLPHLKRVIALTETCEDKSKLWDALNNLVKAHDLTFG